MHPEAREITSNYGWGHDYDRASSSSLNVLTNYAETGLGLLSPAGATVILVSWPAHVRPGKLNELMSLDYDWWWWKLACSFSRSIISVFLYIFERFLKETWFFLFSLANHFQTIGFSFVIFIGLNEYIRTHFLFSFLFRGAKLFCALIFI